MITPEWRDVKKVCDEGVERSTNICLDPNTKKKDRVIAASEARVFQQILDLQQPDGSGQFQGEPV